MSLSRSRQQARAEILLGKAWFKRGRDDIATEKFNNAIALAEDEPAAHRHLGLIGLRAGDIASAAAHLARAAELAPGDELIAWELQQLSRLLNRQAAQPEHHDPTGKICFREFYDRSHHRSGWRYALEGLYPLHNPGGTRFEHFLEEPFAWQHPRTGKRSGPELVEALLSQDYQREFTSEECGVVPIRCDWVGVFHNPPDMPASYREHDHLQSILAKQVWQESLQCCRGLFTFSRHCASWLQEATGRTVSVLTHPTEIPDQLFSMEAFQDNPEKKVIQVGWWLRQLSAIYDLPLPADNALGYTKLRLIPGFSPDPESYLQQLIAAERRQPAATTAVDCSNTLERQHVSDAEYDDLLSRNIVFLQLRAANANNAVIECIARATPLLVNRLPAVVEYLGADYPLYYQNLEQAALLALDSQRLSAAHQHLLENPVRKRLSATCFREQFIRSEVYQAL